MLKYVIKRLLIMIPTILFVVFAFFMLLSFLPSSPGRIILGNQASLEQVEEVNERLGYNDPVFTQFLRYVKKACMGDFGESYRHGRPVFEVLMPKFPVTLKLAIAAIAVSSVLGIPIGIVSAVCSRSAYDRVTTVLSLIFASVPSFFLGVLLVLLFSLKLKWLPSNGLGTWKNFIMPIITLALPEAAFLSRLSRTMMLDTMEQDYIRTARSKGCSPLRVIFCHGLRNALMPVVTVLGMGFAGLLGGAIITEQIFGLPGFGSLILSATQTKDIPMIMGSTIFLSAVFMVIMLAVDIIYALLDPRVADSR